MVSGLPIALVGYGKMGRPMGRRLLAAGHRLIAHDLEPAALRAAAGDGLAVAGSPAEAARRAGIVITMLPHPRATTDASYGDDGVLAGLQPGALWIEMGSSDPALTAGLAAEAGERKASLLDAPVSGGVAGAGDGTLTIFAGGPPELLERARPLLELLGSDLFHVGDRAGDGDLAKTLNNLLSAVNLTAAAEALTVGIGGGLDPARLVAALGAGSGASHALNAKIPGYVLTGRFDAGFTISQMLKDLGISREVAAHLDVPLSIGSLVYDLWTSAAADGHGDSDHTMMAALIAARAGVDIGPR